MQQRFHMQKGLLMVESRSIRALEVLRKTDSRFKRARIKSVLQAHPSQIDLDVVYLLDTNPPEKA